MKMKLHAELIFIWKVSHLDSFWNRGKKELWNGLMKNGARQLKEQPNIGMFAKSESYWLERKLMVHC